MTLDDSIRAAREIGIRCHPTRTRPHLPALSRTRLHPGSAPTRTRTHFRFHPTRGIMTLGKSQGGLPPDSVVEDTEEALADAERLIQSYHDPGK